jgi:hypothetical protein
MTTQRTLKDVLAEPATLDDVIATLHELIADLGAKPDGWENPTLERYLEALAAWLQSQRSVGDTPSWRLLVTALEAAKIYE